MANQLMPAVVNPQLDLLRSRGKVVIEDGSIGRIFGGGLFGWQGSAGEAVIVLSDGVFRTIEEWRTALNPIGYLAQRCDVVENPERTTVGGDDEIVAVDD